MCRDVAIPAQARQMLAVGATDTIWRGGLMDGLVEMYNQDSSFALRMETGSSSALIRELLEGALDVVCVFDIPDSLLFQVEKVGEIALLLLSTRAGISMEDTTQDDFVHISWGKNEALTQKHEIDSASMIRTSAGWLGLQWLL